MGKFTWFLVGGVLGAGAALALTPKTGEEARALVAEKVNALAGEAKDFGAGFPDSAVDMYNTAREQGAAILKGAQDKTTSLVGDVKGGVDTASDTDADELRAKIEAARQRIAAQVMENAEKAQEAVVETAETVAEEAADKADEAKHAAK